MDVTNKDFEIVKIIGHGSFGKVYLVKKKDTEEQFAMKAIKKSEILNQYQLDQAELEMNILL